MLCSTAPDMLPVGSLAHRRLHSFRPGFTSSETIGGSLLRVSRLRDPRVVPRAAFQFGHVHKVNSEDEINSFVKEHADRTVVLECKSTTCKPCMKFKPTYTMLATRFADSAFLEVYGDECDDLRKLMGTWKIRTTPTFRIYRGGVLVFTIVGAKRAKLVDEILAGLNPEHSGRDWTEPEVQMDSDSDDDY